VTKWLQQSYTRWTLSRQSNKTLTAGLSILIESNLIIKRKQLLTKFIGRLNDWVGHCLLCYITLIGQNTLVNPALYYMKWEIAIDFSWIQVRPSFINCQRRRKQGFLIHINVVRYNIYIQDFILFWFMSK